MDQQPVAWAQRVTISTDAVSSMSESDLDAVQHRLEDGLEVTDMGMLLFAAVPGQCGARYDTC